jgi:hypothetical protein
MSGFTEKKRNAASKDQCGYCGEPALLFNSFGNYRGFGKPSFKDQGAYCGFTALISCNYCGQSVVTTSLVTSESAPYIGPTIDRSL